MKHKILLFILVAVMAFSTTLKAQQFVQQGPKLKGTGAVGLAEQGWSVSLSADGNTAIVGGYSDNSNAGAAWVYTRTAGVWTQQGAKLTGTGATGAAQQGFSVSLSSDGNTAIVGGQSGNGFAGAAWVFTRNGGVWTQQGAKLTGTGATGKAKLGYSVSLSSDGNTAVVGGPNDNSIVGTAWVYTRSGGIWTQQGAKLTGTAATALAQQGISVSLSSDGNTAIVGGNSDNGFAGAAWVYTRTSGVWTQQGAKLTGTGAVGAANQGWSVSLSSDGNTAIVGGNFDNDYAGAAWVYTRSGGVWTQQGAKLTGAGAAGLALQGLSVSLSSNGNTAIVGGFNDNGGAGAVWVYTRSGGVWTQQGSKLTGTGAVGAANQGRSVSLSSDGNTAIVGGSNDNSNAGAAWVFDVAAPAISSFTPISAASGATVTISGTNFTGTTAVSFGGTAATSFTVVNATTITAVITAGASGSVSVTTAGGKVSLTGFVFNYDHGPLRIINTVAGIDNTSFSGDGGFAINAAFNNAFALSTDTSNGNIYITDGDNFRMRKLNVSNGIVTTFAGNGTAGFSGDGGLATAAQIDNIQGGSAFDKFGNFYFADFSNGRIRKVAAVTGIISTVAGGGSINADNILATNATFSARGVAVDSNGNLFIVETNRGKIRKVDAVTGIISTVAGKGGMGYNGDSILAVSAMLNRPQNIALDKFGNIYIADHSNYRIRKVNAVSGVITTVIGNGTAGSEGDGGLATNAQINGCWSVALDNVNNIYVADSRGNRVRKVDEATGIITTIAGTGSDGFSGDGGDASLAKLTDPTGITVDNKQNVYVTDNKNRVRKISLFNSDITVCPNSNISFTSDLFGDTYKWQTDTGSNGAEFFDLDPNNLSFSGISTPVFSTVAYSTLNTWKFRCLVNGVAGKIFTLKIADTWNGSVSTAWENAANWNCNSLPDSKTDVFINSGTVIINSNVSCGSLVVKPGANVIVNPGFNFTITK